MSRVCVKQAHDAREMPTRSPSILRNPCQRRQLLDDTMGDLSTSQQPPLPQRSLPDAAKQAMHSAPRTLPILFRSRAPCRLISQGPANRGLLPIRVLPHAPVPVWAVPARAATAVANSLLPSASHLWSRRSCSALAMRIDLARVPLPAAQTVRILHEFTIRGCGEQLVTRCG